MARTPKPSEKAIHSLKHEDKRLNNPTAELASLFEQQAEIDGDLVKEMRIPRDRPLASGESRPRDPDRDPQILWNNAKVRLTQAQLKALTRGEAIDLSESQLVWRGKDSQDWSDLVVNAPPIYVQEKVHPKAIIDDLKRRAKVKRDAETDAPDLFADFNGLPDAEAATEFYQHPKHWQNRMILGDSLQVMASLAEREALRGKVQCIYLDPPYGIKFNSNWQVSTLSRDVKDGKAADISREPEQVKAFRDTWKDGIHSYLTYLRDRLTVARELLTESGSIFVQIGDENVHRVRAMMEEVFGEENYILGLVAQKTGAQSGEFIQSANDFVLWFARNKAVASSKFRPLFLDRASAEDDSIPSANPLTSDGYRPATTVEFRYHDRTFHPGATSHWKVVPEGIIRLGKAGRIIVQKTQIRFAFFNADYPLNRVGPVWNDLGGASDKLYVVQTTRKLIERALLMSTDPGDLVLDPTCGSGTTAIVAEQWGRRWITIDTSRVALALARARLMGARYPYYLLADSPEGREKEQEISGKVQPQTKTHGDVRQGFVYGRAPHVTLKSIADNTAIDDIWDKWQTVLEPVRQQLNVGLATAFEEWEIPRDLDAWLDTKDGKGKAGLASSVVRKLHADWWTGRIARQKEIDASIAKAADVELLYDRPYEDKSKVRVAGPFTVESLSPHRVVASRDDTLGDEFAAIEGHRETGPRSEPEADFAAMVLTNLRTSGVHSQAKADTIHFSSLEPWPGDRIAAIGTYEDGGGHQRRAGVLIGPEFGTLSRADITRAAREASDARFDALVACAFNFEANTSDLVKLGPLAILKARMNPDLHMAEDLKNTGKGNLFVVFGEPDVELIETGDGSLQVKVHGIDVFDPSTGDIRSDGVEGIAAWFIDTDYNEESFFVRHAYFLGSAKSGGSDPYKSLKTALKAEIDEDAWASLYSDVSRPFPRPSTGRIAVKVINHFGDEVLKVFGV